MVCIRERYWIGPAVAFAECCRWPRDVSSRACGGGVAVLSTSSCSCKANASNSERVIVRACRRSSTVTCSLLFSHQSDRQTENARRFSGGRAQGLGCASMGDPKTSSGTQRRSQRCTTHIALSRSLHATPPLHMLHHIMRRTCSSVRASRIQERTRAPNNRRARPDDTTASTSTSRS